MINGEIVKFKGMVDGVRINLSNSADIFEIIAELEEKIEANKGFFGDGDCRINFGGRNFSSVDKKRLEELLKKLMPMCRVEFEAEKQKELPQTDWILAYKERNTQDEAVTETEVKETDTEKNFVSVLRSNRARYYQGIVKEGMVLRSDGHLILLGNVNEGASLIAAGNIVVIGSLCGTAHAGCNGHNGSYIIAMDMHPEGLAVSQTAEEYFYSDETADEDDNISDKKRSFFDNFRKRTEEDTEKDEPKNTAAIALLKNDKIEIDNFTIQDFTNLKNMV